MTKRKVRPPVWSTISLLSLNCRRADGRVLAVMVSVPDFVVLGFEVDSPERGASELEAASAVFGSHAHKVVGQASSLAEGCALAEAYAAEWLGGVDAPACSCGEIARAGE